MPLIDEQYPPTGAILKAGFSRRVTKGLAGNAWGLATPSYGWAYCRPWYIKKHSSRGTSPMAQYNFRAPQKTVLRGKNR